MSNEPVVGNSEVKKLEGGCVSWNACSAARRWRGRDPPRGHFQSPDNKTDIAANLVAEGGSR